MFDIFTDQSIIFELQSASSDDSRYVARAASGKMSSSSLEKKHSCRCHKARCSKTNSLPATSVRSTSRKSSLIPEEKPQMKVSSKTPTMKNLLAILIAKPRLLCIAFIVCTAVCAWMKYYPIPSKGDASQIELNYLIEKLKTYSPEWMRPSASAQALSNGTQQSNPTGHGLPKYLSDYFDAQKSNATVFQSLLEMFG